MVTSAAAHGARGAGFIMLAQAGNMVLQLLGVIVLSRLLTPDDFGLIAIVTVLMGIGGLIRDFGMGTASLQEQSLTQQQASNLFWANTLLSGATAAVLAGLSPLIAAWFNDDRLTALVLVMAGVLLTTGLQTQYQMRLARQRRFLLLAAVSITSIAAGLAAGIAAALAGWGYWALAVQQAVAALWTLLAYIAATRWVPSRPSRDVGSTAHLRAGTQYGLANLIGYLADNVDTIMIGLRFGPAALGTYNRAFQLFMQPVSAIFIPLTQVVVPTIHRLRAEGRDPGKVLLSVQSVLVSAATVGLVATAVTAEWLIPLLIGDQWGGVVPLVQILAVGGVFKALSQINYWAYVVHKQARELLYSNLVTKPLQIVLIVTGAFLGVEWVAWAYVLGRAISWPINLVWLARTANQPSGAALRNGLRIIGAAGGAALITGFLLHAVGAMSPLSMVAVGVFALAASYMILFIALPGGLREVRAAGAVVRSVRRRS